MDRVQAKGEVDTVKEVVMQVRVKVADRLRVEVAKRVKGVGQVREKATVPVRVAI